MDTFPTISSLEVDGHHVFYPKKIYHRTKTLKTLRCQPSLNVPVLVQLHGYLHHEMSRGPELKSARIARGLVRELRGLSMRNTEVSGRALVGLQKAIHFLESLEQQNQGPNNYDYTEEEIFEAALAAEHLSRQLGIISLSLKIIRSNS